MAKMKISNTGEPYFPYTTFEEYSERFKNYFSMKRENGIIEVRHHKLDEPDEPATWRYGIHKGWGQLAKLIGQDPENEVLIMTGTGDAFLTGMDPKTMKAHFDKRYEDPTAYLDTMYPMYRDGSDLLYNMVFDLHIPTISAINGPSVGHTEFALMTDMTLCTPQTSFHDGHFSAGVVPGDGQHLVFNYLCGYKRANYMAYMGKSVSAQKALELGIVNEVVELKDLLPRAWEMARTIMKQDRVVRRLTHDMIREPLRRTLTQDFPSQFAMEWWGAANQAGRKDVPTEIDHFNSLLDRKQEDMLK